MITVTTLFHPPMLLDYFWNYWSVDFFGSTGDRSMGIQQCTWSREYPLFLRFIWYESCMVVAAEFRASWTYSQCSPGSWSFCWGDNHIEISDWKLIRLLLFRHSRAECMIFLLAWPNIRRKQKRTRIEAWSESMDVDLNDRQFWSDTRHW